MPVDARALRRIDGGLVVDDEARCLSEINYERRRLKCPFDAVKLHANGFDGAAPESVAAMALLQISHGRGSGHSNGSRCP